MKYEALAVALDCGFWSEQARKQGVGYVKRAESHDAACENGHPCCAVKGFKFCSEEIGNEIFCDWQDR